MSKNNKPNRPKARLPRGFVDREAGDIRAVEAMCAKIKQVYELYGFDPVETPLFEYTDALGKFLPDSDRPNEGVFSLTDDDEQWMSLRYDLTAPLARFAAQGWETLPKPFRRYAFGPVWRNEKPGPGRFREFVQCDADTVGSDRPEADAEKTERRTAQDLRCIPGAALRVQLVITRLQNEKKLASLPYTFVVSARPSSTCPATRARIRMGVETPVPVVTFDESDPKKPASGV